MSPIVGIDLGTTNSLIGVMEAGFPILLADGEGERLTPSVVHFPSNGPAMIGRAAARMRVVQPQRTVYSVKRFIGRRWSELSEEHRAVSYQVTPASGGALEIALRPAAGELESCVTPELVSARILEKLKADAERALGIEVTRAVITVPAYFNDAQRQATKAAGELAGLTVERIVNEPTAAALAYGLDKLRDKARVAVFDLGGGTFDISILELNQGVFQVLSTNGNTRLGGDDIDAALVEHVSGEIISGGVSLPTDFAARLREAIIGAKHQLSTAKEAPLRLAFDGGRSVVYTLTRGELEGIAQPIIHRTRAHCLRALADARLKPGDLDEVILVGGQTRMPLVRRFVAEIFSKEPNTSQNPDEAVALGATIQAGILSGAVQNVVLLDVTPLSLGIETFGGLMNVIIPRNSTIPTKAGEMFTNAVAGQTAMQISVLQGERELARDNWRLGEFELPFEHAPKGHARVGVQFEIDANGILHVLARDTKTGAEKVVQMTSAVDVSDEAVEKMLEESLEHAFEDMSARVFTEAKLKSEELLPAVRKALERVGSALSESERAQIQARITDVEQALTAGGAPALKRANTALDEATQRLATLLIEQAMRNG
jgi:molecular chaperone DnaK